MKLYHYANCDTCRKAKKWLDARGIAYEALPIRETPPSKAELQRMLAAQGGNLRKLFNTSGQDYKQLGMKDKLPAMDEGAALELLSTHGNLVKRPFLLGDGVALVGFEEEAWAAAFG